jgi:hypothetical protein
VFLTESFSPNAGKIALTNRRDFSKIGAAKADLNPGGGLSPLGSSSRPDPQCWKSKPSG